MVWEGKEVVKTARAMIGLTNPLASAPGTIRGDLGIDVGRNVVHGSDSVEVRVRRLGCLEWAIMRAARHTLTRRVAPRPRRAPMYRRRARNAR
jgi:hypothetical protein